MLLNGDPVPFSILANAINTKANAANVLPESLVMNMQWKKTIVADALAAWGKLPLKTICKVFG